VTAIPHAKVVPTAPPAQGADKTGVFDSGGSESARAAGQV
jgi:hypothetical protein